MDYLQLAQRVVQDASAEGREVEVIITEGKETEISISQGEVEQLQQNGPRGMGVRVLIDGRTGYAFTSDFSEESIAQTWQTAIELAQVATPDEFRKLPPAQAVPDEDLGLWHEAMVEVPTEEKIAFAKRMEQAALDTDDRIFLVNTCDYGDQIGHTYLANSKGFASSYGQTVAFGIVGAIAKDGDQAVAAFDFRVANSLAELDAEMIGQGAAQKALRMLGGQPVPTQTTTVVLDHLVGAQILGAFSAALSAESWQRSRSFLIGKMGQEIGSSMVTIMDNGRLKGGLGSAPFDGEGVPTKATRLVDEGVLQNLIYDSYTAAKDDTFSTGNAARNGHRGLPRLGPSNFYMQPGLKSRDELIADVEDGFYVLSVMQTGGIDPVTGDCSMSANGVWIKDGQLTDPIGGVTIATTLGDFLQNISDVGSDLRQLPFMGSLGVPTLRVDNVRVGGSEA